MGSFVSPGLSIGDGGWQTPLFGYSKSKKKKKKDKQQPIVIVQNPQPPAGYMGGTFPRATSISNEFDLFGGQASMLGSDVFHSQAGLGGFGGAPIGGSPSNISLIRLPVDNLDEEDEKEEGPPPLGPKTIFNSIFPGPFPAGQ